MVYTTWPDVAGVGGRICTLILCTTLVMHLMGQSSSRGGRRDNRIAAQVQDKTGISRKDQLRPACRERQRGAAAVGRGWHSFEVIVGGICPGHTPTLRTSSQLILD
jgi:hypothetical protein